MYITVAKLNIGQSLNIVFLNGYFNFGKVRQIRPTQLPFRRTINVYLLTN